MRLVEGRFLDLHAPSHLDPTERGRMMKNLSAKPKFRNVVSNLACRCSVMAMQTISCHTNHVDLLSTYVRDHYKFRKRTRITRSPSLLSGVFFSIELSRDR
jgi:hypothetical protein